MSVYALADLHGNGTIYNKIKNFLKPNDTVYFLGDAIDRGPDGWTILKDMIKDPRFRCLMGNHEDMMLNALYNFDTDTSEEFDLWMYNGGFSTKTDAFDDSYKNMMEVCKAVKQFSLYALYTRPDGFQIYLSHSGWGLQASIEEAYYNKEKYLWDRKHFLTYDSSIPDNMAIVHGHTPIFYMDSVQDPNIYDKALYYNNNKKIDIDCGTIVTKESILLDLNTFDEHIFKEVD